MSIISTASAHVNADPVLAIFADLDCEARDRAGNRCYKQHPANMADWCPVCLDGHSPDGPLPEWMGGVETLPIETGPTASGEFTPSAADETEYLAMLATDADHDRIMAEWFTADRDSDFLRAMGEPDLILDPSEMIEFAGYSAPRYAID